MTYNKNHDYCTLSPDSILGVKFNYGCYLHDRQYRNETKNRTTRKLADKKIYTRIVQRQIEVWNKIRDYADHGHFNEYKKEDVEGMFKGVSNFLSNYLK